MLNVSLKNLTDLFPFLNFPPSARLKGSKFDNKEDLKALTESFDSGLKSTFSDNAKQQYIKFGSPRDKNLSCGVKDGKFSVLG